MWGVLQNTVSLTCKCLKVLNHHNVSSKARQCLQALPYGFVRMHTQGTGALYTCMDTAAGCPVHKLHSKSAISQGAQHDIVRLHIAVGCSGMKILERLQCIVHLMQLGLSAQDQQNQMTGAWAPRLGVSHPCTVYCDAGDTQLFEATTVWV